MKTRAGDWVEVRSKEEILRTLDKSARLDGLPFMPQMFNYCGHVSVSIRARTRPVILSAAIMQGDACRMECI
jgi:hypothetical protein